MVSFIEGQTNTWFHFALSSNRGKAKGHPPTPLRHTHVHTHTDMELSWHSVACYRTHCYPPLHAEEGSRTLGVKRLRMRQAVGGHASVLGTAHCCVAGHASVLGTAHTAVWVGVLACWAPHTLELGGVCWNCHLTQSATHTDTSPPNRALSHVPNNQSLHTTHVPQTPRHSALPRELRSQ